MQELGLQHILLGKGSLHDVFVKLRGSLVEVIKINHLGHGMSPSVFFEDIDENDFMNSISVLHPLGGFLFYGAPWVPQMEDLLEGSGSDIGESDLESLDSLIIHSDEDWEDSEEHMSDP